MDGWLLLPPPPPLVLRVGLPPLPGAACLLHTEAPSPGPTCCRCGNGFTTAWAVPVLLTRSQRLPSRAPWGGWGSPLPGRGREKEVDLNPPLSLSPFLPVPLRPLFSHLVPGWCPRAAWGSWPPGPGLQEAAGLCPRPSPCQARALSASGGFGCDTVQVPRAARPGCCALFH